MATEDQFPARVTCEGLENRARRMAEANALLERLIPFERWQRGLTPSLRFTLIAAYGSVRGAYTTMRDGRENEATEPVPSSILIRPDGSVVLRWDPKPD